MFFDIVLVYYMFGKRYNTIELVRNSMIKLKKEVECLNGFITGGNFHR